MLRLDGSERAEKDLVRYEPARRLAVEAQAGACGPTASAELEKLLDEIEASTGP